MLPDHTLVSSGQAAMATVLGGLNGGGFHGGRFHGGGWGHHGPWGFGRGRWGWIWWRILQEIFGVFDRVFVGAEFKMLTLPSLPTEP
jgi:hypothetical protein